MTRGVRRPVAVVVLVALVTLFGLADALIAAAAWLAIGEHLEGTDAPEFIAAAIAVTAIAVAIFAVAVALWMGRPAARVFLTLALAMSALYTVADAMRGEQEWGPAALTVGAAVALLALTWSPWVHRHFRDERERDLADALEALAPSTAQRRWRRAVELLLQAVAVWLTILLTPGVSANSGWAIPAAAIVVGLAGWALQPLIVRIAGMFGWWGALFSALFAQALVVGLGLWLAPGIEVGSVWWAIVASWVYAIVSTALTWLFAVSAQDYLILHATRLALRNPRPEPSDIPGVLFIQLDGVPAPLLENEIRSGNLPTISRWIRSGSHTWAEWVARVPSTTPVSQAGILHGSNEGIPAFRWFDRELGRMLVANKPADAAVIEDRLSDGRGLLADDGVSISNLFSGDAPTSLLTMSGVRGADKGLGPSSSYAAFFTHPAGFARALTLTLGEMAKEMFQARRQIRRGVEPRVHRSGAYIALRGVTNVFLRDLNVALVVEAMMQGRKSVYVDFVDYDEIAHHAGVTRPESLASLYGLDSVLRSLETLAESGVTPRPYEIVLVSDHGQSQGATFLQRYGVTLEEFVASHTGGRAASAADAEAEARGPVSLFVHQLAEQDSVSGRVAARALRRQAADSEPDSVPQIAVIGSGNLGGVWFTESPDRLTVADLENAHAGLVEALAAHPGIGFVVVMANEGPAALNAHGVMDLATGEVTGENPLAGFPRQARADLLRAASFASAPDIYVNSLYDPVLDEVAAFEELVGCHGGLGGWQTRPMLVHPAQWRIDADLVDEKGRLYGADAVHRQLVRWLQALGQRTDLA